MCHKLYTQVFLKRTFVLNNFKHTHYQQYNLEEKFPQRRIIEINDNLRQQSSTVFFCLLLSRLQIIKNARAKNIAEKLKKIPKYLTKSISSRNNFKFRYKFFKKASNSFIH